MYKFETLFSTYLNESLNFDNIETNENNFEELLGRINNPWITNGIIASISHRDSTTFIRSGGNQ